MALTLTRLATVSEDGARVVYGTITPDDSHASGGEDFPIASIGLTRLSALLVGNVAGYSVSWNGSTSDPEVDIHYVPALDGDAASAQVLAEAASADLSTLSIPFVAVGI